MDAIAMLMEEHRLILRVLDRLDAWAHDAKTPDDREALIRICEFLSGFVDPIHHIKEEDLLFPALVARGFPIHQGPIAVMLQEHEQGRALTDSLASLSRRSSPWTLQDLTTARPLAIDYAGLLRHHIFKEDRVLYPMARDRLPAEQLEQLGAHMAQLSALPERAAEIERLRTLVSSL